MSQALPPERAFAAVVHLAAISSVVLIVHRVIWWRELLSPGAQYLSASGDDGQQAISVMLQSNSALMLLMFATLPACAASVLAMGLARPERAAGSVSGAVCGLAWSSAGLFAAATMALVYALAHQNIWGLQVACGAAVLAIALAAVTGFWHLVRTTPSGRTAMAVAAPLVATVAAVLSALAGLVIAVFAIDRNASMAFYDPDRGADPIMLQHLIWFLGAPEVVATLLTGSIAALVALIATGQVLGHMRALVLSLSVVTVAQALVFADTLFTAGI